MKITFSFLWVYKIAFVFLFSGLLLGAVPAVYGQDTAKPASPQVPVKKDTPAVPEISDIIPLAAKIEAKLALTEKSQKDTVNQKALK
ncbi:hypothetical protein, partial [uncultured Eudoraea sp.]|uniref:hypothetical protein n=1 Tax=uncultured Eudoraea sp. TaxID=1035614 RepID=UPI00261BFDB5